MRKISWTCMFILATEGLSGSINDAKGADSIRAQDLAVLPEADRIVAMKAILERRVDKVRNIDLMCETRTYNFKCSQGKLGERVADLGWYEFHIQHCDGSYRVKSTSFLSQSATVADSMAISHYDEKSGVIRVLSQQANRKGNDGRIGREHLPSMLSNRAIYYLLGGSFVMRPVVDKCDFLLESLAACSDKWQVDVNAPEQQVTISHPYRAPFLETGTGTRKVYFDARKGMLPVRVDVDFRAEVVTSLEPRVLSTYWIEYRIVMSEAQDFGGFWMPMRMEERNRASTGPPGECTVFVTKVKRIIFGGVKASDLQVKFPPDTMVADKLKNVFYRTGPDGEASGPINPIGIPEDLPITLDEHGQLVQKPKQSWMLLAGLWSLGIAVALFLSLILLRRLRAGLSH